MANRTDPIASTIHGTNPQFLLEAILRMRIYQCSYWKEHCFGLSAATLVDKAMKLNSYGSTFGPTKRPTKFICLILKMLQIQPDMEIIKEFIMNEDFKYVRLLGAVYLRLVGRSPDIYQFLEPLYNDYRVVRKKLEKGYEKVHIDEVISELLSGNNAMELSFPHLLKRWKLEEAGILQPRESPLEEEADILLAQEAAEATIKEEEEKKAKQEQRKEELKKKEEERENNEQVKKKPRGDGENSLFAKYMEEVEENERKEEKSNRRDRGDNERRERSDRNRGNERRDYKDREKEMDRDREKERHSDRDRHNERDRGDGDRDRNRDREREKELEGKKQRTEDKQSESIRSRKRYEDSSSDEEGAIHEQNRRTDRGGERERGNRDKNRLDYSEKSKYREQRDRGDRDRDRDRDRNRDRDGDKEKKKPQESRKPEPRKSSDDGDSLSIEETNKLRAELGLKPLK